MGLVIVYDGSAIIFISVWLLQVRTQPTSCSSSEINSEQKHESSGSVFYFIFYLHCFKISTVTHKVS